MMIYRYLLTIMFCGVFLLTQAQSVDEDTNLLKKFDNNGNCIEEIINDVYGDPEKIIYSTYNEENKKTETIICDKKKKVLERNKFRYDNNGNLVETIKYNAKNKVVSRLVFVLDKNNNMIQEDHYNLKELDERWTYKRDEKGRIIEQCSYVGASELEWRWTFAYDANDNKIEDCRYRGDGRLDEKTTFVYDKDKLIERNIFYPNGELYKKSIYEYTNKGTYVDVKIYNPDRTLKREFKQQIN